MFRAVAQLIPEEPEAEGQGAPEWVHPETGT